MQITSRFTIAVHIIAFVDYFGEELSVTSRMLSGSIHANPVIIRGIVSFLKEDGILISSQGVKGIRLGRKLSRCSMSIRPWIVSMRRGCFISTRIRTRSARLEEAFSGP